MTPERRTFIVGSIPRHRFVTELLSELEAVEAERDKWKANHDSVLMTREMRNKEFVVAEKAKLIDERNQIRAQLEKAKEVVGKLVWACNRVYADPDCPENFHIAEKALTETAEARKELGI